MRFWRVKAALRPLPAHMLDQPIDIHIRRVRAAREQPFIYSPQRKMRGGAFFFLFPKRVRDPAPCRRCGCREAFLQPCITSESSTGLSWGRSTLGTMSSKFVSEAKIKLITAPCVICCVRERQSYPLAFNRATFGGEL